MVLGPFENEVLTSHCGEVAILRPSWSYANPGRQFFGYRNYGTRSRQMDYGFFMWYDPPVDKRRREVIEKYLKRISDREDLEEVNGRNNTIRGFVYGLLVGIVLFIIWVVLM